ncbi:hypothetical protein K470DRAFT_279825 [Piedraia hortae CBS 480.64]|uniref:G-patch domain-containing protein n=1 Tax=Piedraia hortae CBS 480.64 TaxID=1314780 RepID=A0A6A7C8Z7_9PEZI|nr:hypothetical protein K470DRAFT_279825 [Piedraia hortae CBS 480.64]
MPPKKGLSLYAHLIGDQNNTISSAPVKYDVTKTEEKKKDASLQFQPIRRPQVQSKSAKPKVPQPPNANLNSASPAAGSAGAPPPAEGQNQIEDWLGDDDEPVQYEKPKYVRGGRKKKKKAQQERVEEDWDDIYDPSRPTVFATYKGSEEQFREIQDWKARLYHHQSVVKAKEKAATSREYIDNDCGIVADMVSDVQVPPGMSFAPPNFDDPPMQQAVDDADDDLPPPPTHKPVETVSRPPIAFAPAETVTQTPKSASLRGNGESVDMATKKADALAKVAAFKAKMAAQSAAAPAPAQPSATVSRAPVCYDVAQPETNVEPTQSNRPGQKGFAERLLKKYGWEKGQGLGAQGEGITTAIVAKAEKRKKLAGSEGGGYAAPKNMGRLVGGKRRKVEGAQEDSGPGTLSEVVKLQGMCHDMDLDHEIQDKDLFGEIGQEMESSYGKVERVFIWRREQGGNDDVFVKFTSPLSALRCVTDATGAAGGMTFAGNEVSATFFDAEKFEKAEYE